jgi:serine/threonine protein phosphatase 1
MVSAVRRFFRSARAGQLPAIPPGERVYAIGDVHGRRDLFEALLAAVEADDAARPPAQTTIVLLGDLVDRGADSAGVIAAARALAARRPTRILCGNHEEMLLRSLEDSDVLRRFLLYGGRETILSYPVDQAEFDAADYDTARLLMREAIPADDVGFIRTFEDLLAIGDYLFVHAGIEPDVPIAEQRTESLHWIREPFLDHRGDFGCCVVHGHTIASEPAVLANRIGIDTGAFATGRLTALGLEGTERWFIETSEADGNVTVTTRPA